MSIVSYYGKIASVDNVHSAVNTVKIRKCLCTFRHIKSESRHHRYGTQRVLNVIQPRHIHINTASGFLTLVYKHIRASRCIHPDKFRMIIGIAFGTVGYRNIGKLLRKPFAVLIVNIYYSGFAHCENTPFCLKIILHRTVIIKVITGKIRKSCDRYPFIAYTVLVKSLRACLHNAVICAVAHHFSEPRIQNSRSRYGRSAVL